MRSVNGDGGLLARSIIISARVVGFGTASSGIDGTASSTGGGSV